MSRTFAISDLHGQIELWRLAQKYLNTDDTIYYLGDAIDRGDHGYALLKELLADPRVFFIKGNHEDLMLSGLTDTTSRQLWFSNGGRSTYEDTLADPDISSIVYQLRSLPYKTMYINEFNQIIYLCHSGTAYLDDWDTLDSDDLTWDRDHLSTAYDNILNNNEYMVHGHTPTCYVADARFDNELSELGAYFYDNNHKICIDCGSALSNTTCLLDLDTFESITITTEEEENE